MTAPCTQRDWQADIANGVSAVEFDIDGLLERASISFLVGPPKSMKTWCALSWAVHMITTKRFLGRLVTAPPGGHRILYVMAERYKQVPAVLENVLAAMNVKPAALGQQLEIWTPTPLLRLDEAHHRDWLFERAERKTWIVMDSMVRLMGRWKENDNSDVAALASTVLVPLRERGIGVMPLHHTGHNSDRARGAQDFIAGLDVQIKNKVLRTVPDKVVETTVGESRMWAESDGAPLYMKVGGEAGTLHLEAAEKPTSRAGGSTGKRQRRGPQQRCEDTIRAMREANPETNFAVAVSACMAAPIMASRSTAVRAWNNVQLPAAAPAAPAPAPGVTGVSSVSTIEVLTPTDTNPVSVPVSTDTLTDTREDWGG